MNNLNSLEQTESGNAGSLRRLVVPIQRLKFNLRMKTWPARVWLMNLSWLPLWWLKKLPHPIHRRWTPAALIRHLCQRNEYLEAKNTEYLKKWGECEMALRAERMARMADKMTPEQKEWSQTVMGVRFTGSETN